MLQFMPLDAALWICAWHIARLGVLLHLEPFSRLSPCWLSRLTNLQEQEKRKARAARFEVVGAGTTVEQKEKLEKRNKRFGSAGPPAINGSSKAPAEPKMEARSKRFGSGSTDSAELDAKKKVTPAAKSSSIALTYCSCFDCHQMAGTGSSSWTGSSL